VTLRLLEAITTIAKYIQKKKDRASLLHHANMIERDSQAVVLEEWDRKKIEERYQAAVTSLRSNPIKN